jgi:SAM-dependent methyltransferase
VSREAVASSERPRPESNVPLDDRRELPSSDTAGISYRTCLEGPHGKRAYASRVSCPCCTPPSEYRRFFNRRIAAHEARRYRRRGLPKTAHRLVELAGDVGGASVLEVGGGIGTLTLELLEAGAERATNVELSGGYEDAAAALLAEHRLGERVDRHVADFVEEAGVVAPHDLVLLHRVVCCYPNADALVEAAAAHTGRRLLLTYPRERGATRVGVRLVNLWLRLTRCGFRTYAHPVARIVAAAERQGLVLELREPRGPIWENAAFARPAQEGVSA